MVQFITDFVLWNPLISIVVFSFVITFVLTFAYKVLTDQKKMKEIKEKQKELSARIKENRDNPQKMSELQKEMLQNSAQSMRLTLKPMLITFIPVILVFIWLSNTYKNAEVGNIISWGASLPLIGNGAGWLLSYVIFSLIFSIILRRIFKL